MPSKKRSLKHASIVQAFAERLKAVRTARGLTQRELADRAHITFSYVSRLEAGGAAPGIDLLQRLAEALGAKVAELLPASDGPAADREQLRQRFAVLVSKAGPETLGMLEAFLDRLADSPTVTR